MRVPDDRHLLAQGHRRIAYIGGPFSIQQVANRHRGAEQALAETEDAEAVLRVFETTALQVAEGRRAGEQIAGLQAKERPTAVFCANDLLALGLLEQLRRAGLHVPEDIAIIGFDDIDSAAAATVPLSSIRQPREQLGRVAAQLLMEEVEDPAGHYHRQVIFQPDLVVRESSALERTDRPGSRRRRTVRPSAER